MRMLKTSLHLLESIFWDETLSQRMNVYARHNNASAIRGMLRKGWDPDLNLVSGNTPLIIAARQGHLEAVQVLLDHRANVNINSADLEKHYYSSFDTPLIAALTFLRVTASPDAVGPWPPDDNSGVVRALLMAGADPNGRSGTGGNATPLSIAVRRGQLESLRLLLKAGADPHQKSWRNRHDRDLVTPLELTDELDDKAINENISVRLRANKEEMRRLLTKAME